VAGVLLAFATGGVGGAYLPTDVILLEVGGCLVAVGTVLLLITKPAWRNRFLWYSGGFLVLTSGRPQPQVMRWDDLVSLTVVLRSETDEGTTTIDIGSCSVRDRAGNAVTVAAPPGQSLSNGSTTLARKAEQVLTPKLVPGFVQAFDAGKRVAFGDRAWIDREGIAYAPDPNPSVDAVVTLVAWQEMARISISARLSIRVSTQAGQTHLVDLDGIENAIFASHLIDRAAAAAGVEVRYRDDGDIPRRPPTPV
jgi:hypothetical protein